jgi:Zn-dependent M28 family amino/carboxypeptidase
VTATVSNETTWRDAVRELAAFRRPSASDGERRAAEWISSRLRDLGCESAVERERAHGTYWWPIGTANVLALGATGAMADIGMREVVPGANDNLSAVGALLALAAAFQERPPQGVRVLLVSTGSEESFSEGMQAFGERHFAELDTRQTEFLCLECLGGQTLIVLEGEGMLRMRDYTSRTREALADAAARAGVGIRRGIQTVAATDAIIALRAGYPTATLAAIEATKLPLNYHWPNDTPENLHWETIEDAIAVSEEFVRSAATRRP